MFSRSPAFLPVRSRISILLFATAALLAPLCAAPASGQSLQPGASPPADPRIQRVVDSLEQAHSILETALSPDGRQIAWVTAEYGGTAIEIAPTADPGRTRRLTAEPGSVCSEESLAWAPDSRALAFTSDCRAASQPDLYLADLSGNASLVAPRRLTHLHGTVSAVSFSPNGEEIGFLYVEGATRRPGALDAMKPFAGVIGVEGLEIQRVARVHIASGEMREITPANLHVYEYDWAPDSRRIAFIAAPPPGENNWWIAQLYTQAVTSAAPRSIFNPNSTGGDPNSTSGSSGPLHGLQIAVPRWSPDGTRIAFIGGLMSDQGSTGGDLYLLSAQGGEPQDITSGWPTTPVWFHWIPGAPDKAVGPESRIALMEIRGGVFRRKVIDLGGREIASSAMDFPGRAGDGTLEGALSIARDPDTFAYIQSSYASPPAVMLTRMVNSRPETVQITHLNDGLQPAWGKAESIEWRNEGFHVQGWLLYPAGYDPAKRYPLIVSVHGGPSSAVVPQWPTLGYSALAFSPLGYFVLEPNPRGSYGQGEAFTLANRRDFGYGDLRDILAGVDAVSARLPIDQQRVGITGWSYGGFMTMFAVTQTQRFHAAVAGAGISNWQSYYGENSIDQWMIPFFGASVYNDPAVYAKSSAIDFIRNVKTPTLIVVGDRDGECPAPQSFEFWHALRSEHVPTELVVYPNEGHRFVAPDHRRDVLERALSWFEQYLPAGEDGERLADPGKQPAASRARR